MTAIDATNEAIRQAAANRARFGGILWRLSRLTGSIARPLAGTSWNPALALIRHRGRKTGRLFSTPVAARRIERGFVIALAFGAQVDWHLNLLTAGGGTVRWRGREYRVSAPEYLEPGVAEATFQPIQRVAMRIAGVRGFIRVRDAG
jgi:deazaflavin-dependent oxidoreductase (nitroreductase family)